MRKLLLATMFLSACQSAAVDPKIPAASATKVSAHISLTNDATAGTALSVNDGSATMRVRWSGAAPGEMTRLEVYNPKGLMHDQAPLAINARQETTYTLQISGSPISEYNQVGTWTALAYRGDGSVADKLSFDVTQ
jgi:hypothetical protein